MSTSWRRWRSFRQLSIIVGSLAIVAPASSRAQEAGPSTEVRAYGTVGLARGETVRLTVLNQLSPILHPPNPCRVHLAFVDAMGAPWLGRNRQPVSRAVDLPPGESVALTLLSDEVFGSGTALRAAVRAVMATPGPPDAPPNPCVLLAPALEVFDTASGWTQVAYSDPGPLREVQIDNSDGALLARFGYIGLARGLVARLNASRVGLPSRSPDVPPSPCLITLEFRNREGELLTGPSGAPVQMHTELLPGQTTSLELSSAEAIRGNRVADVVNPVLTNPGPPNAPPSPCADVIGTVEIYDAAAGRVQSVWYVNPGPPN